MRPIHRPALAALALLTLAACSDAATAPRAAGADALRATEARELQRVDSLRRESLLGLTTGLLGTTTGLVGATTETLVQVVDGTLGLLLNSCRALPYAATVKIVGPAGGTLRVGPHTLTIPAGALARSTVITAESPSGTVAMVELQPHGLRFAKPVSLTLSHAHCATAAAATEQVAYVDDDLRILEWPTLRASSGDAVSVWLEHFSGYVVAYRGGRER
jgi:hypothetical protein